MRALVIACLMFALGAIFGATLAFHASDVASHPFQVESEDADLIYASEVI